jgi:hypothetical protein
LRFKFAVVSISLLVVASLTLFKAAAPIEARPGRLPMISDWSHRHVVFSQPSSLMQAFRLSQDPRYVRQWIERHSRELVENVEEREHGRRGIPHRFFDLEPPLHRDWSQSLGSSTAKVGQNQYPAKYSFDVTSASCSNDFVVFSTSLGSTSQASVVAYSNLYSGCGGTVPSVLWAYYTGGSPSNSVALSLDGTQIAFAQNAKFVVLKWAASSSETVSSPMDLTGAGTNVSNASYRGCTAPCMTTISLPASDSASAVFVDYSTDTAYLGDNGGSLHQIAGVFNGTPTESGSPWPVVVSSSAQGLRSPVFDSVTGNVFVTDGFGERLYAVCTSSACAGVSNGSVIVNVGTVTDSGPLSGPGACYGGGTGSSGAIPPPILDSAAGTIYIGTGGDGTNATAVIQFPTTVDSTHFSQNGCGNSEAKIGSGSLSTTVFAGAFDNLYLTSGSSSSPTGNFYVCGNSSGLPELYQIPITNNSMGSATAVMTLGSSSVLCSPVTEIYNNGTDWLFMSVTNSGASSGCSSGGCVFSVSVPTTLGGPLPSSPSAALAAPGGASGIVIDNSVVPGTLATSQIYYSTLTSGAAIQASQSGLH